ncbi:hypothetical protein Btru_012965 [Bulinus truncatus]|nr:hypothetical protein Btru_012965 [Bulinus truncatus]
MEPWDSVFFSFALLYLSCVTPLDFTGPLSDTYVVLGRPFWWTCGAVPTDQRGPVTFIWRLKDGDLLSDRNVVMYSNGTLYFTTVLSAHLGQYTCTITDQSQAYDQSTASLYAAYINSTVTASPSSLSAMINGTAALVCSFDARPAPQVVWLKDNVTLTGSQRVKIAQLDGARVMLEIYNVVYMDKGSYSCNVSSRELQLSFLSAPVSVSVYGPPVIIAGPTPKAVPVGYNVTLQCLAVSEPKGVISWTLSGTPNLFNNIDDNGTLYLYSVQTSDSGVYLCTWTNSYGASSSSAALTVSGQPQKPVIITGPSPVSLNEGFQLSLICRGDGNPKPSVMWLSPGGQYFVQSESDHVATSSTSGNATMKDRASIDGSGTLTLENITRYDAGVFTCVLSNPEGRVNASATVEVLFQPVFTLLPQGTTVSEGDSFTLQCGALANPASEITWSIPSYPNIYITVADASVIANENVLTSGYLEVKKASRSHQGTFTCRASNVLGSVKTSAYVTVTGPPAFVVIPVSQGVVEGDAVTLQCQVDSNPAAAVVWYYKYMIDPSIQSTDVAKIKETLLSAKSMPSDDLTLVRPDQKPRFSWINGTSLKIASVLESDAGLYVCIASNSFGLRFEPTILRVITFPRFEVWPENKTVALGSNVTLECYTVGIPVPTQRWLLNQASLQLSSRVTKDANGTLTIYSVQQSDVGQYTCHANNQAGQNSTSAFLQLSLRPHFTSPPVNVTATEFAGVALTCRGNSSMPLVTSWYRSDSGGYLLQMIASTNSSLTLTTPSSGPYTDWRVSPQGDLLISCVLQSHSSWYACTLENKDGVTPSSSVFLTVIYAPYDITIKVPDVAYTSRPASLSCAGLGNPTLGISWVTPLKTVITSDGVSGVIAYTYRTGDGVNSTLMIANVDADLHGGRWVCRACNTFGCVLQSASLVISETRPIVREITANELSNELSVSCKTTGLPFPSILYFYVLTDVSTMPGHRVSENTMYVTKGSAMSNYRCEPSNVFGSTPVTFSTPPVGIIISVTPDSTSARVTFISKSIIQSLLPSRILLQAKSRGTSEWENFTYSLNDNLDDYLAVMKMPSVQSTSSCSSNSTSALQNAPGSQSNINVSIDSDGSQYKYSISADVYNLKPGSLYDFRVFLLNILGTGPESPFYQAMTRPAAPSSVTNITVDVDNRTAVVRWSNPDPLNGQANETDIIIKLFDAASSLIKEASVNVLQPPVASFTNMSLGNYFVEIIASNRQTNMHSNVTRLAFQVSDRPPDYAPEIIGVRALDASSVEVNWTLPSVWNYISSSVTGYVISVSSLDNQTADSQTVNVSNASTSSWVLQRLGEHRKYSVRVACRNAAGVGPYSEPANVTTKYAPFSEAPLDNGFSASFNWQVLVIVLVCICVAVLVIVSAVIFTHQRKLARCKSVDLQHDPSRRLGDGHDADLSAGEGDSGNKPIHGSEVEGYNNEGFTH